MQIQINRIQNGWLVMMPPSQSQIIQASQMQMQPQPTIHYCEDWSAVHEFLGENAPDENTSSGGPRIVQ